MSETDKYPFPLPETDPSLGNTMEEKKSALYQMSNACQDLNKKYTECTDKYYAVKVSTRMTTTLSHFDLCKEIFRDYKTCLDDHMASWLAYRHHHDKQ